MTAEEPSQDVTEQYRACYRGVVAAERRGGEVLVLFDEGETCAVNRQLLAFAGTGRPVLVRSFVDRVPKSRIDASRPLFSQWAGAGGPLEGGGLALAGALRLPQLAVEAFDLGFELGGPVPQVSDESVACAAASADRDLPIPIMGRGQARTGGRGRTPFGPGERGANQTHQELTSLGATLAPPRGRT